MIYELQSKIMKLKREKDVCILAHSYQGHEILEIADYVGDSYQLAVKAAEAPQSTLLMCGVRFMAETCKILSPSRRVLLAHPEAGCPMAEQMDKELIEGVKAANPDYAAVCYINTTAELKTVCDVCVTSSSAVKIVRNMPQKNILFIPDCNLGSYVQKQVPEKNLMLLHGGCPIHASVNAKEAAEAKAKHPGAELLVHPECTPDVIEYADFVGSTSAIMKHAITSECREFIIGTELSIVEHLQYECPDKNFYPLSSKLICKNMKLTTLTDVYNAVAGKGGDEIILSDETMVRAKHCLDEMIRLG